MKPSISRSLRFGASLIRKVKKCFTGDKPTESASGSKERYKGKLSCNLSETISCGDGGYSEMIQDAISYCKDSLIKVANFEYIDEVEAAAEEEARKASTENKTTTNNPDRASYWEELLKDRYEVHKVEDFNAMGKGNRSRKQVMIYRLITRGTIEERMMQMTKKKMVLEHLVVGRLKAQNINQEELNDIIRYGSKELFADENDEAGKSRQIHYDDAAIDRLLNRDHLGDEDATMDDEEDDGFLKAFKKLDVNEPAREQREPSTTGHWEEKELVSRDGQAKLKANVFFASFDQRSDKAVGESACTALAAVIASWLQSNQDKMPTRAQFDRLIVEGSSEWRKLCDNQDLINQFPNKHFDIETVLQARICPISVLHEKSFIGFFGPEKFETLKGVMSFDQIWDEIKRNAEGGNDMPRIYIVSWNDHFFVLKVDVNACYIIDTFGERLFEGCNQAYILRFDDSALMRGKVEKEGVSSDQASDDEICSGKECCREFMKRFLAAIPLRELESKEKKEPVSYLALHQQLQIEFNFTTSLSLSSSSSPSSTNSTSSLFSNESTNR